MANHKYHMRMVAQSIGSYDSDPLPLGTDVCIDVVLRGTDKNSIDLLANELKLFLDIKLGGHWAGIGRGEYVESSQIVLA